jgi:hypothetical protein
LLGALGGIGAAIAGVIVSYIAAAPSVPPAAPGLAPPPAATTAATGEAIVEPRGPLVEEDYFADATRAKRRYEAALGKPVMAKELVLYQYYATLEAQNPKNRDHVDAYKLWANKVERPTPVRLGSDKKQLAQVLFSLDDVDFSIVSGLLKQALAELKLEEGKVTHVFLERDGATEKHEPIWRVYVNGSRESGFVEFSLKGEKRRVIQ